MTAQKSSLLEYLSSGRGSTDQSLMLEWMQFPEFSVKLENWADFRRVLKKMTKESTQGQALEIASPRSAIPKRDRDIVEWIAEPEEAWRKLDERYGERKLTIIAAMSDLKIYISKLVQPNRRRSLGWLILVHGTRIGSNTS